MAGDNLRNFTALSSVAPKVLASTQLTGNGDDVIVAPTTTGQGVAQSAILKTGTLSNITSDPTLANANLLPPAQTGPTIAYVSVWIISLGGVTDGSHRIISMYPLTPGDSLPLAEYITGVCLGPGDSLHANVTDSTGANGLSGTVDIVVTGILNA